MFRSQPGEGCFLQAMLIEMAGGTRIARPAARVIVKAQSHEELRELPCDYFLERKHEGGSLYADPGATDRKQFDERKPDAVTLYADPGEPA
ncbi:MAG: hypothetical protein WB662_16310 [Methyloceanibacter sp.]